MTLDPPDHPAWDEERAEAMIGARVLIGTTYEEAGGVAALGQQGAGGAGGAGGNRLEQMFGMVTAINPNRGFEVTLEGKRKGEIFWLPPDSNAFHPAPAGEYRLKTTGEVVIDPDYTTTWTVSGKKH